MFDEPRLRETLVKVFREQVPGSKFKQQLYDYATSHGEEVLAYYLIEEAHYEPAKAYHKQLQTLGYKHLAPYWKGIFSAPGGGLNAKIESVISGAKFQSDNCARNWGWPSAFL